VKKIKSVKNGKAERKERKKERTSLLPPGCVCYTQKPGKSPQLRKRSEVYIKAQILHYEKKVSFSFFKICSFDLF